MAINFHRFVGGWVDKLGIRLSQLPTKLKLKLKLKLSLAKIFLEVGKKRSPFVGGISEEISLNLHLEDPVRNGY